MYRRLLLSLLLILSFFSLAVNARKERRSVVRMETTMGTIRVALLDEAPIHRDNFLKLVESSHYDGTLVHRGINEFMIQGGATDSREAKAGQLVGEGDVPYTLPAEFLLPDWYHISGALAAARQPDELNPEQRSSGSQFYIVTGKKFGLGSIKKMRASLAEKGIEMTSQMMDDYQQYGGAPHLDGSYTVFGEVIEGMEVALKIQTVPTDPNDRPLEDVVVKRMVVEQRSKEAVKSQKAQRKP